MIFQRPFISWKQFMTKSPWSNTSSTKGLLLTYHHVKQTSFHIENTSKANQQLNNLTVAEVYF